MTTVGGASPAADVAGPISPTGPAAEQAGLHARALSYLIVLGVFAGAAWAYRAGHYQGQGFPHDTFLLYGGDHFHDFTDFLPALRANDPYSFALSQYPPFSFIVLKPLSWVGLTTATVLWTVVVVGGLGAFVARQLSFMPAIDRTAAVVALTVMTYPFLFSFDRGNIEVLVTLMLAAFVWSLQRGRTLLAAVAIGVAAAIKAYPLVFVAYFVVRRQWRALAVTLLTTALLTFLGSAFYGFDLLHALDLLGERLRAYNDAYVIGDRGLGWGCSLFGALKLVVVDVGGGDAGTVRALLPIYAVLSGLAALGVVVALWRLPLRFWEQIMLLTVVLVALPTVSGDYKLLHLVVPMVLFLRDSGHDRLRWWFLAGFALLMIPKAYVLLRPDGTSLGVVVDPLVMLAMAAAIIVRHRGTRALAAARS